MFESFKYEWLCEELDLLSIIVFWINQMNYIIKYYKNYELCVDLHY